MPPLSMVPPPQRAPLFAAACAGIFVFGSVNALLGTLFGLPGLRERLGLDLAGQGNVFLAQFAGIFVSTALVGPLIDRFGNKAILIFSSSFVALGLALFAAAKGFPGAAAAAVVLGIGAGGINTASNVLVSDLFEADRAARLAMLGVSYGIGALVVPFSAAGLSAAVGTAPLLALGAIPAAGCALAYAALAFPPAREAHRFSLGGAARVARYPGVAVFAVMLFCQSGNEASIAGWTSTYVRGRGWDAEVGAWALTGYWAALLLGRLAGTRWLVRAHKPRVLLSSGIGSAVGALLLIAATHLWQIAAGVVVLGLSYANVYPTALAIVGDRYRAFTGTVFGALFSIGLLGGMLFPWAIGHLADTFGLRAGMAMPVAGAILICVLLLFPAALRESSAAARRGPP